MISEETLRIAIGIFFGSLGLTHFIFGKTMNKYAVEADLLNANVAVKLSGVVLMAASAALFFPDYAEKGFYGLCLFLIVSSFILHKFWTKNSAIEQMVELLHFAKNIFLAFILWYLKDKLT